MRRVALCTRRTVQNVYRRVCIFNCAQVSVSMRCVCHFVHLFVHGFVFTCAFYLQACVYEYCECRVCVTSRQTLGSAELRTAMK